MTGGLPAVDVRRTGIIAAAVAWAVLAVAAIARFGLVRGVLLGGWVVPLMAGLAIGVTKALLHHRQEAKVATMELQSRPSSAA